MQLLMRFSLFAAMVSMAASDNVFISVTYGEGSHYVAATAIGEALVKRGHNVTFLISNGYEHRAKHSVHSKLFRYEIFNHSVPLEKVYKRTREIAEEAFKLDFNTDLLTKSFSRWLMPLVKDCRAALSDRQLLDRLRSSEFDVTILDLTWGCSLLFSAYLETPSVIFSPLASQYVLARVAAGAPFLPAAIPENILGSPQRMNFKERVLSFLMSFVTEYLIFDKFVGLSDPLREEFGISPDRSLKELAMDTELILTSSDPVIDIIAPLPPSVIEVGGLLTKPAKPLEKDLEDFMNSSGDDGVIILSLGTYVKVMPQRLNDLFAEVFSGLPQKVVWQLPDDSPTKLSNNIKTMGWLPQNDLLGHPKTKLFIYQGGNNGLYEAVYHGVPTIVLPVYADQFCVAARVTEKGLGTSIDIHSLTAEDLKSAIDMVISNQTYADTAKQLSAIFRDRPQHPADRAAFWVEHVIKFGGKHIRSPSLDLNFVQLHLLDVIAFLLACFIATIVILVFMCKCAFRCCRWSCSKMLTGPKPKQE